MTQPNPHPLGSRPIYTQTQMDAYFSALAVRPKLTLASFQELKAKDPLAALRRVQLLTMALCPFGSLGIHYSTHHTISLDPDALFTKIVERGHGGYCMENNAFWATALRSLGYECYVVGARVSNAEAGLRGVQGDGFSGWGHEAVIVLLDGQKYLTDVGFGGRGSLEPILLEEGETGKGLPGVVQRLARRPIADWTLTGEEKGKMWIVDVPDEKMPVEENGAVTNGEMTKHEHVRAEPGWRAAYCFMDMEWLPQDFEIINFRMCRDPKSMFVQNLILTKPLLDENAETCVGQLNLVKNEVSRRIYDDKGRPMEKEVLVKCTSEAERVKALEEWFGVVLRPEEARAIKGLPSEIRE